MKRLCWMIPVAVAASSCATGPDETPGPLAKETIYAVSAANELISFNAGRPQVLTSKRSLQGLKASETVVGIDYRVAKGQLFALGSTGQLYRVDTAAAAVTAVGGPMAVALSGTEFGVDFNPTVDRVRVVSNTGQNLRLHPETGAVVDSNPDTPGVQIDGPLVYADGDRNAGKPVAVVAAGYTYNKQDEKITTNYAIDATQGVLVMQGSREGVQPVVSPNTGRLTTVGPLNAGAFERATLDISDVSNTAYAALTPAGASRSGWYRIDLATGAATRIGTVAGGTIVRGAAIEP